VRILLCEDEENIVAFLTAELQFEGYAVDVAVCGRTALSLFAGNTYDLIILDIMLPGKNGLEVLRSIRKTSRVPVIMLTARKDVYDKVTFLGAGADDYVTKPFDTMELMARVRRLLEREAERAQQPLDGLHIDKDGFEAQIDGKALALTKTEFQILAHLHAYMGKVQTRDEIIRAIFGDFYGESNIIDANIKNIRAKIARISPREIIQTVRGQGYVIRGGRQ
jgi:two-component system response regulator ArlR